MKKMIFVLVLVFATQFVHAQLANTAWKGTITPGGSEYNIIFIFKTDTVITKDNSDHSTLDVSKFTFQDSILTLTKISGESGCGDTPGKYKITIAGNKLTFIKLEDNCYDRYGALDGASFTKYED